MVLKMGHIWLNFLSLDIMAAILADDNFKYIFVNENSATNFTEICSQ